MARSPARMTPEAREWFLAEIAYIANLNPAAAEKIVARVKKARQLLADHPKIGPAGLIPGTRRFVVKPYILTVRQRDGVVEIAAIRHAKQSDAYTPHEAMEGDETDEPETGSSLRSTELNQDRLEAEPSAGSTGR